MLPGPSPDVSTFDQAAFELFTTDLIEAGYEPAGNDKRMWVGPADSALAGLTDAEKQRIEIRDGWPYRHPYLYVAGLTGRRHVSASDNVCLWDEDDDSYGWLRLSQVRERIAAWCADQRTGGTQPVHDAQLYYEGIAGSELVILDLDTLKENPEFVRDGAYADFRGELINQAYRLKPGGSVRGVWFRRLTITAPPTNLTGFRVLLTPRQQVRFDRLCREVNGARTRLATLLWDEGPVVAMMVIRLRQSDGRLQTDALEASSDGPSVMALRAGPDATALRGMAVTIFGAGAVGSNLAVVLAKAGVGRLILVDRARLRPGDVTRHAASPSYVGLPKVEATKQTLLEFRPALDVEAIQGTAWSQSDVQALLVGSDLAIDATGNRAYVDMLSDMAQRMAPPCRLMTAALYLGGAVAAIRVQVADSASIRGGVSTDWLRALSAQVAETPPEQWEPGCGSPVNNAPPWAVLAAASLAAQTAADILTGRFTEDLDLIEVYTPLDSPPLNVRGVHVFRLDN